MFRRDPVRTNAGPTRAPTGEPNLQRKRETKKKDSGGVPESRRGSGRVARALAWRPFRRRKRPEKKVAKREIQKKKKEGPGRRGVPLSPSGDDRIARARMQLGGWGTPAVRTRVDLPTGGWRR